MARIRLTYVGGGSTRAPGTVASLVERHGEALAGSEVVLVDLVPERLAIVRRLGERLAAARGVDLRFEATTDRRAGLADADAVLLSYRPGGFEARVLDERIPLRHGIVGQETQGPGGFFMALRAIDVLREILADIEAVAPRARVFNYTNPVNILADAATRYSPVPFASFCEGPYYYPRQLAEAAGLDPTRIRARMVGLNHASWSVEASYDGQDPIPLFEAAWADASWRERLTPAARRHLGLAVTMRAIPADYLTYYYFYEDVLAELRAKPTTRAEDILAATTGYWAHYAEQAEAPVPRLDPARSRGGIYELELALEAIEATFTDRGRTLAANVPNRGALPGFPDDLVVEVEAWVDRRGIATLPSPPLPDRVVGLIARLAEYQRLTADAAWRGSRRDAIRALAAHPWLPSLEAAEWLYDEMAAAHRAYLPDRLLR